MGFCLPGAVSDCLDGSPLTYPDEYLFDGGDRALPVHYDNYGMRGLDTEDTVIEYEDESGEKVKRTNRVAIYAPRFGAVMTVSAPTADTGHDKVAGAVVAMGGDALRARQGSVYHDQRIEAGRIQTRLRASGLEMDEREASVVREQAHVVHAETLNVFEDRAILRIQQLIQADEAELATSIHAAVTWTRTQYPVISAKHDSAGQLLSRSEASEVVGRRNMDKPGDLRIIKLADKKIADVGEIVTFTIRYENVGDRELRSLVITDNLTPRLDYVPDSATSDRAGRLVTEPNGEGSEILRWELDEPLPGKTRGIVTFQARVK